MIETDTLGTAPVPGDAPQGSDPRYDPAYEGMLEEIKKLSTLSGGPVNWNSVATLAAQVLGTVAKDFPAGVYLSVALGQTDGFAGWVNGVRVLDELFKNWWDTGFPPPARLRARVNALDWWQERSLTLLHTWADSPPFPAELHATAMEVFDNLDRCSGEKLDVPPMHLLREALNRLPLQAPVEVPDIPDIPDVSKTTATSTAAGGKDSPDNPQKPDVPAPRKAPSANPTPSANPAPSFVFSGASADDVPAACAAFHQFARNMLDFLCGPQPVADPLVWKIVYSSLLGRIRALPPADEGISAVPAPDPTPLHAARQALTTGNALQAASSAMSFAPVCPLWLDVQRCIAEGLLAAGPDYAEALDVVRQECASLHKRLPGLETLAFADATPFADSETRQWFAGLSTGSAEAAISPEQAILRDAENSAAKLMAADNLGAALDVLDKAMTGQSKTMTLRLRLRQIRLLLQADRGLVATTLADELATATEVAGLELWNPELALEFWQTLRAAWSSSDGETAQTRSREALTRIVRLRLSAAL